MLQNSFYAISGTFYTLLNNTDLYLSYFILSYVFLGHNDSVEWGLTVFESERDWCFCQDFVSMEKEGRRKKISILRSACKNTFSNFNFWTTLLSKIRPNFWWTGTPRVLKKKWFRQKSCFLGPSIFRTPRPNLYLIY